MQKRILFDIGANDGSTSIPWLDDTNNIIYAFEPTPQLCQNIINRVGNNSQYNLFQYAVSDYEGVSRFNIAATHDWGTSSLLEYSDNSKIKWPDRTDFIVTEIIETKVIRLDSFIKENNIAYINYLHIDTQGSDLNVLKGLGEYISIVEEGVVEAAYKKDILYKNQNTINETCELLIKYGFTIMKIWSNDQYDNEGNIQFKRIN